MFKYKRPNYHYYDHYYYNYYYYYYHTATSTATATAATPTATTTTSFFVWGIYSCWSGLRPLGRRPVAWAAHGAAPRGVGADRGSAGELCWHDYWLDSRQNTRHAWHVPDWPAGHW